jgi:uncharacterized protein YkwD
VRAARTAAAALLLGACGTLEIGAPAEAPPVAAPGAPRTPAPQADVTAEMAALVNRHRAAAGCAPLVGLEGAARAAREHSEDMARRDYFSHVSPEGEALQQRLARAGVALRRAGENIALDPRSPREVLDGWLRSAGHRRNLEDCAYTHHGLGERAGRWTHVFVTPAG